MPIGYSLETQWVVCINISSFLLDNRRPRPRPILFFLRSQALISHLTNSLHMHFWGIPRLCSTALLNSNQIVSYLILVAVTRSLKTTLSSPMAIQARRNELLLWYQRSSRGYKLSFCFLSLSLRIYLNFQHFVTVAFLKYSNSPTNQRVCLKQYRPVFL